MGVYHFRRNKICITSITDWKNNIFIQFVCKYTALAFTTLASLIALEVNTPVERVDLSLKQDTA
jgi:hypothetical protein